MLDIRFIRENSEAVKKAVEVKGESVSIDEILLLDKKVIELKQLVQELQTLRNSHSKKIPKASADERPQLIEEGKKIGAKLDALKPDLQKVEMI